MSVHAEKVRHEGRKRTVLQAFRDSEFEDAGTREIVEAVPIYEQTTKRLIRELRAEGRLEKTRTVGPAKLYRIPPDSDKADEGGGWT